VSNIIVHSTYGKSELFVLASRAAGFDRTSIFAVSTQPRETRNLVRMLPSSNVVRAGATPRHRAWSGLSPSPLLVDSIKAADISIGDLILADRHVRRFPADMAVSFLNELVARHSDMLHNVEPTIVIGETANASEVVLAGLCEGAGIPYVQPATLRIPSDRFGLWLGPRSSILWSRSGPSRGYVRESEDFLRNWKHERSRPFYFATNNRAPKANPRHVVPVLGSKALDVLQLRSYRLQHPRLGDYFTLPWLNTFRKANYGRAVGQLQWHSEPPGRFALFPLHVQPEASVDWHGQDWRDQLDVVRFLADMLGRLNARLVVKDHANFVWNRGSYFHEQLLQTPNTCVVSPTADSRALAERAIFTFTVSGTIALECGLKGLPVATVADMPWTALPNVQRVPTRNALAAYVADARHEQVSHDEGLELKWFRDYWRSSWEGTVADRYGFPSVLDDTNISALGGALAELVASRASSTADATSR
jgi:hypothetical protein